MAIITIPKPLREKLGDEASDSLVDLINDANGNNKGDIIEHAEQKFEKRLAEEIGGLRTEMHSLHTQNIRWMFAFWIGQIAFILGFLFTFFK
ncbi:MAG: hypothetical protein FVQ77_09190 [Cytophagales bacterium]|nr:hypothetical protein [Cytophagales bacterium]